MIFFDPVKRRKTYLRSSVLLGSLIILAIATFVFRHIIETLHTLPESSTLNTAELYDYYFSPANAKYLALTFDDGPDPRYTLKIAEILEREEVPATFFFVGRNALAHPEIVRQIADMGFEIGNHSFTHSQNIHESAGRLGWELRLTRRLLETMSDADVLFYRPPYLFDIGSDPTLNPYIPAAEPLLRSLSEGYLPIGADIDSKDWKVHSSVELKQNILKNIEDGHIILLHDSRTDINFTIEVLPSLIAEARKRGYTFVGLRDLFFAPPPIITRMLRRGMTDVETNREVSTLQHFLVSEKFLDRTFVTGIFGAETETALRSWQLERGIMRPDQLDDPAFGVVDQKSLDTIRERGLLAYSPPSSLFAARKDSDTVNPMWKVLLYTGAHTAPVLSKIFAIVYSLVLLRIFFMIMLLLYTKKYESVRKKNIPRYADGVSVLIPAFNEEENIASTIQSVLESDHSPLEIIVINDGSTDNTGNVVRTLAAIHPGTITLLEIENGGKARALTIALQHARYDVFVAMDGDTIFERETISNLVRHFLNPRVAAVSGKIATAHSSHFIDMFQSIEYIIGQNIEKRVFATLNAVGVVPGPVGAWRKNEVEILGGYSNDTMVEDQDLTLALIERGSKIIYEPEARAYTETPHTTLQFVKQRFRWIYGSLQCFWKYKRVWRQKQFSELSLIILPNTLVYSFLVPLFYPVVDILLLFSLAVGSWQEVLGPYILLSLIDMLYSMIAFASEKSGKQLLLLIPIQRLYYRQTIFYVVVKSIIYAFEGTAARWGKVRKIGDAGRLFLERSINGLRRDG